MIRKELHMTEFNSQEYLKTLHTKQLLALRDEIYKVKPDPAIIPSNEQEQMDNKYGKYDVSDSFKSWYVSLAEVKTELKTREHVPNAKEAKEIRQIRAKNKF